MSCHLLGVKPLPVQCLPSNLYYKSHKISKLKCFTFCLAVVFAQSIEARCWVHNEDVVGAAPIADAPTTSEWSIILFSTTKVRLILETWQYLFPGNKLHKNCKQNTILIANIKFYLNNIGHFHQTSMTCVMDSERDAYKLLMGHCNIDISPPRMSSLESQLFCTINPLIFCNASNCRIICSNCWLFNDFFFFQGKIVSHGIFWTAEPTCLCFLPFHCTECHIDCRALE